ncbi:cytochrome c [Rhodobacteraceae bacterium CCMM004]|nr:cytochrome c [Rhodobacteraceae bacterium CCMM004]
MQRITLSAVTVGLCIAVAAGGYADSHSATDPAVKARHGHMQLYAFNLGVLGAMAKGEMEFDADRATAAAANLHAVARLDETGYWPEGTSSDAMEGSRALPAIWEKMDDFEAKQQGLIEAAATMEGAAGSLDGIRANIGAVGGACGACHKPYRQSDD